MRCATCNAPLANVSAPTPAEAAALASKGTATEVQEARMVAALKQHGSAGVTTGDFRELGIFQVSARVWNLRKRGYEIDTELFSGIGADGYPHHRMARYRLASEPLALGQSQAHAAGEEVVCG